MSTNSVIIVQHPVTKEFASIYCHWDGYIAHHGPILVNNYDTLEKIARLVSLGNISQLHSSVEATVSYHRMQQEPITIKVSTYLEDHADMEYNYLFANGEWYVKTWESGWMKLRAITAEPGTHHVQYVLSSGVQNMMRTTKQLDWAK